MVPTIATLTGDRAAAARLLPVTSEAVLDLAGNEAATYLAGVAERLRAAGLPLFDQTTVYRTLRQLERSGLVSSFWDTSTAGPARRRYALTQAGEAFLAAWLETLHRYQQFLQALWGIVPPATGGHSGEQDREEHRRD
ncbi:MAG: transcriptional regulator [Chloroflexota bacterium]